MSQYSPQDRYARKAREEGYKARSVYKLEAIDERFHLLKPGMKVLDLGCAPGSFLQYISSKVGDKGLGVGIDLQEVADLKRPNLVTYQGDIFDEGLYKKIVQENDVERFDLITSDLAPRTTGVKFLDGGASLELNLQVLEVAEAYLRKGGGLIMKMLPGFNEGDLIGRTKNLFNQVRKFRPQAIRKSSGESYIVCLNRK